MRVSKHGKGMIYPRGNVWWIKFYDNGRPRYESSKSTREKAAQDLLSVRLGQVVEGRCPAPEAQRATFDDLALDLENEYRSNGRRSLGHLVVRIAHLRRYFGLDRAVDITTARIRAYVEARLEEGATPATVNRDLAALGRMFSLAIQAGRLSTRPHIPRLPEAQPRQGFLEYAEYLAIRAHLPPTYQDVLDFGYHSGWRRGEIVKLEWKDVDRAASVIRLRPELSKNKDGRVLALSEPLTGLIERRWQARTLGCPYVFHVNGRQVGDWRKSWKRACEAAGLPGKLFHDLRRTVVRNLVRAGVPERVAMSVTGHKTRSVFDRYNIVSEADLKQATTRLAEYVSGQPATPTVVPLASVAHDGGSRENSDNSRTISASVVRGSVGKPLDSLVELEGFEPSTS